VNGIRAVIAHASNADESIIIYRLDDGTLNADIFVGDRFARVTITETPEAERKPRQLPTSRHRKISTLHLPLEGVHP
jgi:hypothetical protein